MAKKRLTKEEQQRRRKTVRRKITGGVFLLFALIGVAAVISLIVGQVQVLLSDDDQITQFENQIEFVVALDPVPFNITASPDDDLLLEAAIYEAVRSYPEDSRTYNDDSQLLLPSVEVTRAAARIFSNEYSIVHHTFSDFDVEFTYDEETGYYALPTTSLAGSFYPHIVAVTRDGSSRILSVAYMSPSAQNVYTGQRDPETDTIVKYMEYVMTMQSGGWRLSEVRTPILDVTPSL